MAQAAAQTLADFFSDTQTRPTDYDLILTGRSLGSVGSQLFEELLSNHDISLGNLHQDCGKMIFDPQKQECTRRWFRLWLCGLCVLFENFNRYPEGNLSECAFYGHRSFDVSNFFPAGRKHSFYCPSDPRDWAVAASFSSGLSGDTESSLGGLSSGWFRFLNTNTLITALTTI